MEALFKADIPHKNPNCQTNKLTGNMKESGSEIGPT